MFTLSTTIKKLMAKMTLAVMLMGLFAPMQAMAEAGVGSVSMQTNLADGTYTIYPVMGSVAVGVGAGINATTHVLQASAAPGTGYKVVFGDVADFQKPNDIYFNLIEGQELNFLGTYINPNPIQVTGTVNVNTNLADGGYTIYPVMGTEAVGLGSGVNATTHILQASATPGTGYRIDFTPVSGFTTPDSIFLNLVQDQTLSFTGVYAVVNATPTGIVRVSTNLADGTYGIYAASDASNTTVLGTGNGTSSTQHVLNASAAPGTGYKIVFGPVAGFIAPTTIFLNLIENQDLTFIGTYSNVPASGTVNVSTNLANGAYSLYLATDSAHATVMGQGNGTAVTSFVLSASAAPGTGYQIVFDPVAGFSTPTPISFNLTENQDLTFVGSYETVVSHEATLALTTTPVAGAISVNGTVVGTPANAGAVIPFRVTNPGDYVVSFGAVANYTTPANQTITVTAAQIQANATISVTGVYAPIGSVDNATLRITTNVANAPVSVDGVLVGNAGPATPVSTTVRIDQAHTISFGAVADYTAPANVVLPANTLQRNEVRDVMGTYIPSKLVTITKTAVESAVANNNKRVIYTLVVTNVGNSPLSVTVSDTITGTGKIMNNGGELVYVPGTFTCGGATCTLATPDGIANQPVVVALQSNGSTATLKYEMLSNNAAQTGPATFSNTATATYIDPVNSQSVSTTVAQTTTVSNPTPVNPGNNGSTSGSSGGSGVGGGHALIKGDMNLTIQKLVSTDGKTFRPALGNKQAIAIPENQTTKLYVKIVVTNPSDLSARNIRLAPFFDTGKSDMTADKMQDLNGATLDIFKQILIEKIMAKETVEFTYSVLVHENGQNSNPAIEGLEVTDIDSFLPDTQDGLVYKNKGQKIGTYLYAGRVPAEAVETPAIPNVSGNGSDILRIKVTSDKSHAAIGETVNFTLTLTNISDQDLTGLFLNHNLPHELSVVNAGGARNDGRTLAWQSPILRVGESMAKRFSAKVVAGAPGSQLKSLTTALVSELEGIEPVESVVTVLGGAPAGYRLAQTGPASLAMLMVLAFLSALAFTAFDKRRTLKLKEAALKPL